MYDNIQFKIQFIEVEPMMQRYAHEKQTEQFLRPVFMGIWYAVHIIPLWRSCCVVKIPSVMFILAAEASFSTKVYRCNHSGSDPWENSTESMKRHFRHTALFVTDAVCMKVLLVSCPTCQWKQEKRAKVMIVNIITVTPWLHKRRTEKIVRPSTKFWRAS